MNELPSPSELAPHVLQVLKELGGSGHFKEIEKGVAQKLDLSVESLSQTRMGKRTEFAYRLSWARTKCKNDGLIINTGRGYWQVVK
jgi:restriction endonuclease Mrr